MTKKGTVVEFSEPIALGGLDWQWERGDRFALVEAVALCAANRWDYPPWVRKIIDGALTNLYMAVYPDVDLDRTSPGRKRLPTIDGDHRIQAKWFAEKRCHSLDLLGLATDRASAVQRRKETLRDIYIAEEIASRCRFVSKPRPAFRGINRAIDALAVELVEDGDGAEERSNLPPECRGASYDVIKRAWSKYKNTVAADYLDYHGSS